MGFIVDFYSFAKKSNSTKTPPDNTKVFSYNAELKHATNILAPVLIINQNFGESSPAYVNYCYIPLFHRYYHVTNWTWINGLWECSCNLDSLASWRAVIGASSQYVERCADSTHWDGTLIDSLYPCKSGETKTGGDITGVFINPLNNTGFYVVGIINDVGTTSGSVTYYGLSPEQMANMKAYLLSDEAIRQVMSGDVSIEISQQLLKALYNPFQYIVSCKWFPFDVSVIPNNPKSIKFGYWTMPSTIQARNHVTGTIAKEFNITFPANPSASSRGAFLNMSPFTKYGINLPPFGQFVINPEQTSNRQVHLQIVVDIPTGTGILSISSGNYVIQTSTAQVAVDIPLSQISQGFYGQLATAVSTALPVAKNALGVSSGPHSSGGGSASGGFHAGDVSTPDGLISAVGQKVANTVVSPLFDIAGSVADAISANDTQVSTLGTVGTRGTYTVTANYYASFKTLAPAHDADVGRPVCKHLIIDNIASGFIKCSDAHIVINGTLEEAQAIEANMNAGFYFE